ncbi:MAG: peptidoglycan-binding domain-containing protein [Sedimentibacter sp.]
MRPIVVDGVFGPDTTAAVIAFQILYGLPVTGVVDLETWSRLSEVYQLFLVESETSA